MSLTHLSSHFVTLLKILLIMHVKLIIFKHKIDTAVKLWQLLVLIYNRLKINGCLFNVPAKNIISLGRYFNRCSNKTQIFWMCAKFPFRPACLLRDTDRAGHVLRYSFSRQSRKCVFPWVLVYEFCNFLGRAYNERN